METKWTPGPWKRRDGAEWIVDAARGYGRVASVGLGRDEADANAHLIAAAPDLYAALDDALWALGNCAAALSAAGIESTMADPTPAIRAAIAKARGEA